MKIFAPARNKYDRNIVNWQKGKLVNITLLPAVFGPLYSKDI